MPQLEVPEVLAGLDVLGHRHEQRLRGHAARAVAEEAADVVPDDHEVEAEVGRPEVMLVVVERVHVPRLEPVLRERARVAEVLAPLAVVARHVRAERAAVLDDLAERERARLVRVRALGRDRRRA